MWDFCRSYQRSGGNFPDRVGKGLDNCHFFKRSCCVLNYPFLSYLSERSAHWTFIFDLLTLGLLTDFNLFGKESAYTTKTNWTLMFAALTHCFETLRFLYFLGSFLYCFQVGFVFTVHYFLCHSFFVCCWNNFIYCSMKRKRKRIKKREKAREKENWLEA